MDKILLVSKDTQWSNRLYKMLKKDFDCLWADTNIAAEKHLATRPSWTFFFHWSEIVPEEIYGQHRCVVIHTSNLPEGRGGTPLQNQILDGVVESRVNAICMGKELDGGDVYCSLPITLQGSITDIWMSIADRAYELIQRCVTENPEAAKQLGDPKSYKRNKNNEIPFRDTTELLEVYRFIQMLDGETYPRAFIDVGNFRLEFSRGKLEDTHILSDVLIKKRRAYE